MQSSVKRARFREILSGTQCVRPASVFDPLSARAAEDLGYELSMLAGSSASYALLGAPDLALVTATELAELAARICRASALPLLVDADHGFGNALNVGRCIESLEIAGVAAVTIEDTLLPLPFGASAKDNLISVGEAIGKIKSALAARDDAAFAIVGRSSAAQIVGIAACVERLKAYEDAGADALFAAGALSRSDLETLATSISLPLIVSPSGADLRDVDLAQYGVRIALQGNHSAPAAARAVRDTLERLRRGEAPIDAAEPSTKALMDRLSQSDMWDARRRRFLSGA